MAAKVKITTAFPSVEEVASELGVSLRRVKKLRKLTGIPAVPIERSTKRALLKRGRGTRRK